MLKLEQLYNLIDQEVRQLEWPERPEKLYGPLQYMMDMGGKRIRPRLCLISYNLFKDDIGKHILSPALALEVFHNFTLIHDDIMDNADIRRGRPTVYRKWDNNVAILSGDTMCIWAFKMLGQAPADRLDKVLKLFSQTTIEICEGQQMDMDFEDRMDVSLDEYIKMIGLKTSVLLACSSAMGAVIAGADDHICKGLYDFAYKLGLAFQIQDDYLDSFGDEKTFGKKIGGDILNNKKTWLLIRCREEACKKDAAEENTCKRDGGTEKPFTSELEDLLKLEESEGEKKIQAVKDFYRKLGIDTMAQKAIVSYYQDALHTLEQTELAPEQKKQMEIFAQTLVSRNK
ncbi:MAG: polyprenyl synthetase family protein [Bacteroidales bacterium]|nr:polyprenyl synthetase family protein [Bacteroidales bacterium]